MNELYHHGIKGQRWGIRRFQNEDGSYTKAGRKRYALDLDSGNTNRRNVAAIRTGEAKRRYDVAKANNSENYVRLAELKGRVRSAKRNERNVRKIDRGAELASKGQTMTGNNARFAAAVVGAKLAKAALSKANLSGKTIGNLTLNDAGATALKIAGMKAIDAVTVGYGVKKAIDNQSIRAYNNSRYNGKGTIKSIGSTEYADVVKRQKKNS